MILAFVGRTQTPQKTRILFVLDASQSMLGRWDKEQKMKVATRLMSNLMDSLKTVKNLEVALQQKEEQDPELDHYGELTD